MAKMAKTNAANKTLLLLILLKTLPFIIISFSPVLPGIFNWLVCF